MFATDALKRLQGHPVCHMIRLNRESASEFDNSGSQPDTHTSVSVFPRGLIIIKHFSLVGTRSYFFKFSFIGISLVNPFR